MAAPKNELFGLPYEADIFVADIGIPSKLYGHFGMEPVPFNGKGYLSLSTLIQKIK